MSHQHLTRFAVVTQSRTGSNMLVSLLDSHPQIRCYGELFNPESGFGYEKWTQKTLFRKIANKYLRDFNIQEYIKTLMSEATDGKKNVSAFGFKLIYPGQYDRWPGFRYLWRTQNYKIITLTRRNLLRKYVSSLIASKEGVWSTPNAREDKIIVHIDIPDFMDWATRIQAIYKNLEILSLDFRGIQVTYEELISPQRLGTIKKILSFIGVADFEVETLKSKTAKQNPQPLEELIENYDEVRSELQGTQFESLLAD